MFRTPKLNLVLPVLLTLLAGCSPDSGPLRATWEYVELTKDDTGHVKEIGAKHILRSGGDEMYQIQGKELEVVTVTSAKAKFRLSGSETAETKKEIEIPPHSSEDIWLGTFGVRLRVEKIGTIP